MAYYNPQKFFRLVVLKVKILLLKLQIIVNLHCFTNFLDKGDQSNMIISIYGGLINSAISIFLQNIFKDQNFNKFLDSQNKVPSPFDNFI